MAGKKDVLEKVRDLIKLSQSDNEEEARTAAVTAITLMRENKLVLVPQTELDRVNEAMKTLQAKMADAKKDGNQKMLIGALLGFAGANSGLLK